MADDFRFQYGETNPVVAAVDSATVIEIGDLVFLDTGDAKPAKDETFLSSLALTQEALHDHFLGVAGQGSDNLDTDDIRVASSGVFEFECASATWELGDLVGADDNVGGTALLNQQVITVGAFGAGTENRAIGRVAKREPVAVTKVLVSIESTIYAGGPQAPA